MWNMEFSFVSGDNVSVNIKKWALTIITKSNETENSFALERTQSRGLNTTAQDSWQKKEKYRSSLIY